MYYELYEDPFNIWFCVFIEHAGHNIECTAIERIPFENGKGADGTIQELVDMLIERDTAWRQWTHREHVPGIMFNRGIVLQARKIAASSDLKSGWTYYKGRMSMKAARMLGLYDDESDCEDCRVSGLISED